MPVLEGMYYFGEPWGEVAEHMPRGPAIPGAICDWCREPVLAGQSGIFVPPSPFHEDSHEVVEHCECWFAFLVGPLVQYLRDQPEEGFVCDRDTGEMTRRERCVVMWAYAKVSVRNRERASWRFAFPPGPGGN